MAETIKVSGLREVQSQLYSYSQQLGDRVVRGSLRLGANLVKQSAQEKAPFKSGKLKRGIVVRASRIHRGKSSKDLIGVYLTVARKKKTDPFYGRFQEDGWVPAGKKNGLRLSFRNGISLTRRAIDSSRVTKTGASKVRGKEFMQSAFIEKRDAAADLIARSATAAAEVLARKVGL